MAKVSNGLETLPKISIAWVGCNTLTVHQTVDDRQTTDRRQTDDRRTTDRRQTDGRRHKNEAAPCCKDKEMLKEFGEDSRNDATIRILPHKDNC